LLISKLPYVLQPLQERQANNEAIMKRILAFLLIINISTVIPASLPVSGRTAAGLGALVLGGASLGNIIETFAHKKQKYSKTVKIIRTLVSILGVGGTIALLALAQKKEVARIKAKEAAEKAAQDASVDPATQRVQELTRRMEYNLAQAQEYDTKNAGIKASASNRKFTTAQTAPKARRALDEIRQPENIQVIKNIYTDLEKVRKEITGLTKTISAPTKEEREKKKTILIQRSSMEIAAIHTSIEKGEIRQAQAALANLQRMLADLRTALPGDLEYWWNGEKFHHLNTVVRTRLRENPDPDLAV